jgi:phosphate starvation-inducible PhoH-like protein
MNTCTFEITAGPIENQRLLNVCGPLNAHLHLIEQIWAVHIRRREKTFAIKGEKLRVMWTKTLLQRLYARSHQTIEHESMQLMMQEISHEEALATVEDERPILHTRRQDLQGRTPNQVQYLEQILAHDITLGVGPAGTVKTFLAVACAIDALERQQVQRIVLTRPAVEAGERLGFLPGDLAQKVDPYLRPLYDALYDLMGFERVGKAFEKGQLEIAPLAFMRGRTLNRSFIILDEAQNTTPEQMKMFLTRMGFGAKVVITGDTSQVDLPRGMSSGLIDAQRVLKGVAGIAMTEFTAADVVRHPLVARIVRAYEACHRNKGKNEGI